MGSGANQEALERVARRVVARFKRAVEADWEMTIRDPDGDEKIQISPAGPGEQQGAITRPTPLATEHEAVAPPGWENTVKKMKKHEEIDNPWALAWYMKNKGAEPHHAAEIVERVVARFKQGLAETAMEFPTQDALQKYLEKHPGADKSRHTVKKHEDEGGGEAGPKKPHALDDIAVLKNHPAFDKIKSGKASKDEFKSAMDAIDEHADKLAEAGGQDYDFDNPEYSKLEKAKEHLSDKFHEAVQKSPEYKTTRAGKDYYPQKKPANYKEAEAATKVKDVLSPEEREWAEKMPDADLDKNVAYDHPRIKAVSKALQKKIKSGELNPKDLATKMGLIEGLRSKLSEGLMSAKTDEEADGWRFPGRQLYKLWQGYNDAIQSDTMQKKQRGY